MKIEPQYNEERKILNQSAFYSIALYSRMFIKILGGILIAKFLGPALYGIRNAFDLVVSYDYYSNLGTFDAMKREIPYYRGEQNKERVSLIETNVFGINFLYSLSIGSLLILASFYLRNTDIKSVYIDFVFFLGLLIITNKVKGFYSAKLITDKNVFLLGRVEMLYGFINTLACVTLVYFLSLRGLFIGLLIADVAYIGYIFKEEKRFPVIRIQFPIIIQLLKIGFPIMFVGFLLALLENIDRIIIIAMLTKEMLGYYGIATVVTGIIFTMASVIKSVFFPRLMEKFGRTKDIYRVKNYLIEPTVLVAYFTPLLLAVFYFSIHLPFRFFLTQYLPSVPVVQILSIGLFFVPVYVMPLSLCIALNRQMKIVFIAFPTLILNLILNISFIRWGWGIEGVALGTGISYLVFNSVLSWYALKLFHASTKEILKFFLLIYAPIFYAICLIFILDNFLLFDTYGFWNDTFLTLIKIAIFWLLYFLIFTFIRKNSAIVKLVENIPLLHSFPASLKERFSSNN